MKRFNIQYNIGKAKYCVNFHDGKSTHKDGSPFFAIKICKSKTQLKNFINELSHKGYVEYNGKLNNIKLTLKSNPICGICGTQETHDSFCKNGHDHWVEARDFFDDFLGEKWVNDTCFRLNLTPNELLLKIIQ
jgi:hypothetical protein